MHEHAVQEVDAAELAADLNLVLTRLSRRLRSQQQLGATQIAVLGRLDREGPQSIGDLARAEHVRPQSMSETVVELNSEGLVVREADESDGRRAKISLTEDGTRVLLAARQVRNSSLHRAIVALSREELEVLYAGVRVLNTLDLV